MALTDKNIVITPNVGSTVDDPKIVFTGASSSSGPFPLTVRVYPTQNGTISIEGSSGQLFSVSNNTSGTIFSVNDISGIPSIEVLDTGLVKLAQYSGNVLLGSSVDNGAKLQVTGSAKVTGTIDADTVNATTSYSTSDERLKTNIHTITDSLSKLQKIRGVTFEFKNNLGTQSMGVIAQEVLKVAPEAVTGSEDTHYSVSYGNLVGLLIEAIKDQQKIINSQEERLSRLEALVK